MSTPTRTGELLEGFAAHLSHGRGLSGNTVRAYTSDLLHLAHFIDPDGEPDPALRSATLAILRSWLGSQSEAGLSRTTLARRGASVRAFYGWATDFGFLPENPAVRLASARPGLTLPTVLSPADVVQMLEAATRSTFATGRPPSCSTPQG